MESFLIKKAEKLKSIIRDEAFNPTWLGLFLNQFYFSRRALYAFVSKFAAKISAQNILDIGCGSMPYKHLFSDKNYTGLEYDTPLTRQMYTADVYYDGAAFPFPDGAFDCILCFQVLEHVPHPREFLKEINRTLATGGEILLTAPFMGDEHEKPHDYFRFTSFGMRQLFEEAGFEIVEFQKTQNDFTTIIQLINFAVNKHCGALTLPICAIFNILGLLVQFIKTPDMYSDNAIYARKK